MPTTITALTVPLTARPEAPISGAIGWAAAGSTVTTSDPETTTEDATSSGRGDHAPWGRVDEDGIVFVRDGDGERQVGEYPDATPEEALAYYERKFTELAAQVTLLEQRVHRGAPPADVAKAVAPAVARRCEDANAVGDLEALRAGVAALGGTVEDLTEKRSEEHKAEVEAARADRVAIVEEAEALAAQDPATVQWKATTQAMDELFARWQERAAQRRPPAEERGQRPVEAVPRRPLDDRHAPQGVLRRARPDAGRRPRGARSASSSAPRRSPAPPGTRSASTGRLLDEWKAAGRAGKKVDDALWARFKAAGDVLYPAKAAVQAEQDAEFGENLTVKLALLDEAEPLLQGDRRDRGARRR